ncbi:MAG: hypothetical protein ACT4QE_17460 [Anaerolineales bacterium]
MPRTLSRHDALKLFGLAATMTALAACDPRKPVAPTTVPAQLPIATPVPRPTPQMREHAESIGLEAWLAEQLNPIVNENADVTDRLAEEF